MMAAINEHGPHVGIQPLCTALGVSRASYYRRRRPKQRRAVTTSGRALSAAERDVVLQTLHEPRFIDQAPAEVYATLLDEGVYHCSLRTMYRILAANHEVRERRNQLRHRSYAAPELLATKPNEVWSWDITKLRGPAGWSLTARPRPWRITSSTKPADGSASSQGSSRSTPTVDHR